MNPTGQSRETDASLLIRFGYRKQRSLTVGLVDDHRATFWRCNMAFYRNRDLLQRFRVATFPSYLFINVLSICIMRISS